jgi:probable HAF family extracellular repeat protein
MLFPCKQTVSGHFTGVTPSLTVVFRAMLCVVVALSGLVREARADVEYDFSLIEAFEIDYDLREVMLRDINEDGVVSGTATHQGSYSGFWWTEATGKSIVPLTWPLGLNNVNQVVSGGTIHDLDTGTSATAAPVGGWPIVSLQAINDNGVAVGYSECSCSNSGRVLQSAMVWDAQNGSRTIPIAAAKELLRINDSGWAVGNIRGGSAGSEGFLYNVGTGASFNMTDRLPPYQYGRAYSELQDINEVDMVCGRGWDGGNVKGLTWSEGAGFTFLPAIPGGLVDRVYPRGINAAGTVVGFADLTPYSPRAFVWSHADGMRNLNDLVVAPPNFILDWALKINDQGWIIGVGHYGPYWGTSRGFVLRPRNTAVSGVDGTRDGGPSPIRLLANPVLGRLDVQFDLNAGGPVRMEVFDTAGRQVASIMEEVLSAGTHTVSWEIPLLLKSSVYFVRLVTGEGAGSTRFVLAR